MELFMSRRSNGIPCATNGSTSTGRGLTRLEAIAERRSIPGVMLFAGTGDILFMNTEAELLNQQILAARNEAGAQEVLPIEILDLCVSLRTLLKHENPVNFEGQHELRRVAGDSSIPVLLRGFPLASHSPNDDACMLVLMEKIGRERNIVPDQAKEQFRLTAREVEIVKYISEGWTNKEIAHHLDISEHTVKEHVRHLLKKTKSTTRTGILAQIFQDT
jgi:DNA-binding CsgD family transcriptional regulator